jgi:hypothetical protein
LNAVPHSIWLNLAGDGAIAQTPDEIGLAQFTLVEVLVHQFFGRLGGGFDHLCYAIRRLAACNSAGISR